MFAHSPPLPGKHSCPRRMLIGKARLSTWCASAPVPRRRWTRWKRMLKGGRSGPIRLRVSQLGARTSGSGILAFATGAGKTFTALDAIRESLKKFNEVPLVIVPDKTLFAQWFEELLDSGWATRYPHSEGGCGLRRLAKRPRRLDGTRMGGGSCLPRYKPHAPMHSVPVSGAAHIFFLWLTRSIALGRPRTARCLMRLSLAHASASLRRRSARVTAWVHRPSLITLVVYLEPRYTLADAVRDRVLTPYFYRPHTVSRSCQRKRSIGTGCRIGLPGCVPRLGDTEEGDTRIERLLFARADIVKRAAGKVDLAVQIMNDTYKRGQRWIIYCDDRAQLDDVTAALAKAGHTAMPYHSAMEGDRAETLRWLDRFGGIVIAIKCLDEGVDIPSVTHALILASSKNPREFVQRRGRVLRRARDKPLAFVYDAIVMPPSRADRDHLAPDPITSAELARAIEFAQSADNPAAYADLLAIAIDAGIDWQTLTAIGVEENREGH